MYYDNNIRKQDGEKMDQIRLTAENETIQGDGVCRLDGKVTFVWGLLSGETGLCELEKQDKKKIGETEQKVITCASNFLGRQMEQ